MNILITADDIKALFSQIVAITGSKTAAYKVLHTSSTHYKRVVLHDPEHYAEKLAIFHFRATEFLKKHESSSQHTVSEPSTTYQDKDLDDEDKMDNPDKRLNRLEIIVNYWENKFNALIEQNKALSEQNTKRENAFMKFITSDWTKDDKEVLRTEFEQALSRNVIIDTQAPLQTSEPATPKPRKRKPKQDNDQQEPEG